jgi:hypothetical protein
MNSIKGFFAAALIGAALSLAGCSGGGAEVHQYISTVSKGKELEDLKRALDAGAINQSEYSRLQAAILRRPD